jgi:ATP-binding cassette subfamily B protein
LTQTGLIKLFEKFPQGLFTVLGDGGVQISGGQKQIVGLARALVVKPKLLLLDELTSNMDRANEEYVIQLINELKKDTTILNITHNVKNALYSDNIIVLSNGKIEAYGKHQDLIKTKNQYSYAWQALTQNITT